MRLLRRHPAPWGILCSLVLLASACTATDEDPGEAWISPLDGQTGWDPNVPLVALAEDLDIPPDYPLPELIRVSNLDRGGFIAGKTELLDGSIRFTPDEPFDEDSRFAWIVDVPAPVPHGPSLTFPAALQNGSIFDTSSALDVLGATLDTSGEQTRLCAVLSRKTEEADDVPWTLEVNGETVEVVGSLADPAEWAAELTFPEGDNGVDVLCFEGIEDGSPDGSPLVEVGDRVRLYLGVDQWVVDDVGEEGITAAVSALRETGGEE